MHRKFATFFVFLGVVSLLSSCHSSVKPKIVIGSKFFTEQVILAELLAQHIEDRTGIPVERKTNLGGTLLVQKAMQSGGLDLYVEYTGTALTAVLNESPGTDNSTAIYNRVKQAYAQRLLWSFAETMLDASICVASPTLFPWRPSGA